MKNKLDLLKVFAILCVVVGHVTNHYEVHWAKLITFAIYVFHMPLFIAVSGAVFKIGCDKGKYTEFFPFILNKFKRLLIPFFFAAMIVVAPTLVCCGESSLSYYGTVVDILRGGTNARHLWFLMALFWMFVIVWAIVRAKINLLIVFTVSIVVSVAFRYVKLPYGDFGLCAAITKFPMFVLGMLLCNCKKIGGGVIYSSIAICVLSEITMVFCKLPIINHFAGLAFNASAVCICFVIAELVFKWIKDSRLLSFFVKQSFGIYLFHMTPIWVVRGFGWDVGPLWVMIPITVVIAVAFSFLVAHFIRYCNLQLVIGER